MKAKKTRINSNFGNGLDVTPFEADRAAKAIAINSPDPESALLLLDMLGLVDPQPENRPMTQSEYRQMRSREHSRNKRYKSKVEKEMQDLLAKGVTLEEVGEE